MLIGYLGICASKEVQSTIQILHSQGEWPGEEEEEKNVVMVGGPKTTAVTRARHMSKGFGHAS